MICLFIDGSVILFKRRRLCVPLNGFSFCWPIDQPINQ